MTSAFILVRLNKDGSIAEIISAHPTMATAKNAERFYRKYTLPEFGKPDTDIIEASFEV